MKELEKLVTRAEHYLKAAEEGDLRALRAWRDFARPNLLEAYRDIEHRVLALAPAHVERLRLALQRGHGARAVAKAIADEALKFDPDIAPESESEALALAAMLTDLRLLADVSDAQCRQYGCHWQQSDVALGDDPIEVLAQLYRYETDALGDPSETSGEAIAKLVANVPWNYGSAPALVILRWASESGYLHDYAAEIRAQKERPFVEATDPFGELFAATSGN